MTTSAALAVAPVRVMLGLLTVSISLYVPGLMPITYGAVAFAGAAVGLVLVGPVQRDVGRRAGGHEGGRHAGGGAVHDRGQDVVGAGGLVAGLVQRGHGVAVAGGVGDRRVDVG